MVKKEGSFRNRLYEIVFESDTLAGRLYDSILILSIIISVGIVIADSVSDVHSVYGILFWQLEWAFTIIFTLDYLLRVFILKKPGAYIFSFYGIMDFISTMPTYLAFIIGDAALLLVVTRIFRLMRLFRIFKLGRYIFESHNLRMAMKNSKQKIVVFLIFLICVVLIISSIMSIVEKDTPGFENIPRSMYWAVSTMTTTGYGDVVPETPLGKFLASLLMILAYGVLAVPTGIISAEIVKQSKKNDLKSCRKCGSSESDPDARYCNYCGEKF